MSKYSQDLVGILRGVQLVAGASLRAQEQYLKHLWSHSSVREAVETNVKQTQECSKKVIENPGQEFQNVNHYIKETFQRSSVVLEGLRQYMSNGRSSEPIGSVEISQDSKSRSYSTIKNIQNLDIASITLKELENLLAEHNKIREVNLRIDENFKPKKIKNGKKNEKVQQANEEAVRKAEPVLKVVESLPPPPSPPLVQKSVVKDEKQVESMMKFITDYDRKQPTSSPEKKMPEVSKKPYCSCRRRQARMVKK
jgi:hypothetical protein